VPAAQSTSPRPPAAREGGEPRHGDQGRTERGRGHPHVEPGRKPHDFAGQEQAAGARPGHGGGDGDERGRDHGRGEDREAGEQDRAAERHRDQVQQQCGRSQAMEVAREQRPEGGLGAERRGERHVRPEGKRGHHSHHGRSQEDEAQRGRERELESHVA
jgi:hypothetical protein